LTKSSEIAKAARFRKMDLAEGPAIVEGIDALDRGRERDFGKGGAGREAKEGTEAASRRKNELSQRREFSEGRTDRVESDCLNGRRDFDPR
jgi:hypothetical protein